MNDLDRSRALAAGWLTPRTVRTCGLRLRPFSLGSLLLTQALDIQIGEDGFLGDDPDASATLYAWAHSEPLDDVLAAIQAGTYSKLAAKWEMSRRASDLAALLPDLESMIRVGQAAIIAAEVDVREKPKKGSLEDSDEEPDEIIEPFWIATYLAAISEAFKLPPDVILWETHLAQALQMFHSAIRRNGAWTVLPGALRAPVEVPEDVAELQSESGLSLGGDDAAALALLEEFA